MKKREMCCLFSLLLVSFLLLFVFHNSTPASSEVVKSAEESCPKTNGYVWCAETNKCIKFREENCTINSFEECANAGFPVIQSYPKKCAIPGGMSFVEEIE